MIFNYLIQNGMKKTFYNFFNKIVSSVYRKTYTVMLLNNCSKVNCSDESVARFDSSGFNKQFLLNLSNEKIKKWESNKAIILVLKRNNVFEGYIVVHFTEYFVEGVGYVQLEEKQSAWLGPIFVCASHRSKGVAHALINSALALCVLEKRTAYTSANIDNIASIRSFQKCDFSINQIFKCKYFLGNSKIVQIMKSYV